MTRFFHRISFPWHSAVWICWDIWYDVSAEMVVVAGDAVSSGIYNLDGSLVGAADASSLESGFYIAVAVMADGSRQTLRFVKK